MTVTMIDPTSPREMTPAALKSMIQENSAIERPTATSYDITNLYATSVAAYAATNYWADAMRMVRWRIVDDSYVPGKPFPKVPADAQDLQDLFTYNFSDIVFRTVITDKFWGQNLIQKIYNPGGYLKHLRWINPNQWRLDLIWTHGLEGFYITGTPYNAQSFYLPREQAVYMHGVDFRNDYMGVSPLEVAFMQAGIEVEIAVTQLNVFRNSAIPAMVVQPAENSFYRPDTDARQTLSNLLRRVFQGSRNQGRTAVLPTRWDFVKLQGDLDKLGMVDITDSVRDTVWIALGVNAGLLRDPKTTRSTSGTQGYDLRRGWLQTKMIPEAHRYAQIFTDQVVRPADPRYHLEPDFTYVAGLEEDISARTNTVKAQVADTLLDLGSAQIALGIDPDPNLKGLYMIGGIPVPSDKLQDYWRFAPGNPGQVPNQEQQKVPTTTSKPANTTDATPSTETTADQAKKSTPDQTYIPDERYREIKIWKQLVQRKGVDYDFAGKSLPPDIVSYGKLLLGTGADPEVAFEAIKSMARKDYAATEQEYRSVLYDLITSALGQKTARGEFGALGRAEIDTAFRSAYMDGLREGGVDSEGLDDQEQAELDLEIKSERGYWTAMANEIYRQVIPLYEQGKTGNTEAQLAFAQKRDDLIGRIDLWVNKGLRRIKDMGVLSAKSNQNQKWLFGGTIDHCESCSAANGQVHRARNWKKNGVLPRSDACKCGGFKCQCDLVDTTEPVNGSLSAIPRADGA